MSHEPAPSPASLADAATDPTTDPTTDVGSADVVAPVEDLGDLEPSSPPLIGEDGRVRLSFSRIDTYRQCPTKFRYAYIDRLPGKPGPHLSFGTSVHAALEAYYDRKLPEPPTEDEALDFLYEGWDSSGFAEVSREEQLRYYRQAQEIVRTFHRTHAPVYRLPADTEAWFELPVGEQALVVGSIDRVDVDEDGAFHVVDYKTNRKVKDRTKVARSLQLAIYALACEHLYGTLPATVALDFVVAGVVVQVPLEDLDLDAARAAVESTAQAVLDEAYDPTPNNLCDWCDFRGVCPAWHGPDPDSVLGPAVQELARLRRQVSRDVEALRQLEDGVARLEQELRDRGLDPLDG